MPAYTKMSYGNDVDVTVNVIDSHRWVCRVHLFLFNVTSSRLLTCTQFGGFTSNCSASSITNLCLPANFMAASSAMRPMGVPLRKRSRTSKAMCQPAAPHAMKRRSMLLHNIRGYGDHRWELEPFDGGTRGLDPACTARGRSSSSPCFCVPFRYC